MINDTDIIDSVILLNHGNINDVHPLGIEMQLQY